MFNAEYEPKQNLQKTLLQDLTIEGCGRARLRCERPRVDWSLRPERVTAFPTSSAYFRFRLLIPREEGGACLEARRKRTLAQGNSELHRFFRFHK